MSDLVEEVPVAGDPPPPAEPELKWSHAFTGLGPAFFTALQPTPLPAPTLVSGNAALATELGLPADWLATERAVHVFTGNLVPEGSQPIATVYSGHQFGVWAGQLGDGRAILLGGLQTPVGVQEIQLKGSGLTPYSRMGDGRAVLRSSIREYLGSEAMHALGIPTTRALALTASPQPVRRETVETAAVVTRVAPSFIRFGHFEHFAARGQIDELRALADFVIDTYYPDCRQTAGPEGQTYAALLQQVSERTAALVAQWQAVGFCHGVMNTDNMSILGQTIDYGPFQFLDGFVPDHICNHSDNQGRYAYNRQPNVAYWNLFCLGQALLPLIGDQDLALEALESYKTLFPAQLEARMRAKLGLRDAHPGDRELVEGVLKQLAAGAVDYPIFWRRLSHAVGGGDFEPVRDLFPDRQGFDPWLRQYLQRLPADRAAVAAGMLRTNPKWVLRNHLAELAIRSAQAGDFTLVATLLRLVQAPFDEHPEHEDLAGFPPDWASTLEISCSS